MSYKYMIYKYDLYRYQSIKTQDFTKLEPVTGKFIKLSDAERESIVESYSWAEYTRFSDVIETLKQESYDVLYKHGNSKKNYFKKCELNVKYCKRVKKDFPELFV